MEAYKSEIDQLRSKVTSFEQTFDKITGNLENTKKAHNKEMADYVKEQNQKYNDLLKKKLDLEDLLQEKDKRIAQLQKELEDLQKKYLDDLSKNKNSSGKVIDDMRK